METVVHGADRDGAARNHDLVLRLDALGGIGDLGRIAAVGDLHPVPRDDVAGDGGEKIPVHGGVHRLAAGGGPVVGAVRRCAVGDDHEQDVPIPRGRLKYKAVVGGAAAVDHGVVGAGLEHPCRVVVVVEVGVVVRVAAVQGGGHDQIGLRAAGDLADVGVGGGIDVDHAGLLLGDLHVIGSAEPVLGRVHVHLSPLDRDGPPLVPLGGEVAVLRLDAVGGGGDQQQIARFHRDGIVAFQGVAHGGDLQGQVLEGKIVLGFDAVVEGGGHDQGALAHQFEVAGGIDGPIVLHALRAAGPKIADGVVGALLRPNGRFRGALHIDGGAEGAGDGGILQNQLHLRLIPGIHQDLPVLESAGEGVLPRRRDGVDGAIRLDGPRCGGEGEGARGDPGPVLGIGEGVDGGGLGGICRGGYGGCRNRS